MTVFNLKTDFGAAGDGTTDDAHAFVAAGDALTGTSGNSLTISAGTNAIQTNFSFGTGRAMQFWASGIVQLTINGAGAGTTTIDFKANNVQFGGGGIAQDGNHFAHTAT